MQTVTWWEPPERKHQHVAEGAVTRIWIRQIQTNQDVRLTLRLFLIDSTMREVNVKVCESRVCATQGGDPRLVTHSVVTPSARGSGPSPNLYIRPEYISSRASRSVLTTQRLSRGDPEQQQYVVQQRRLKHHFRATSMVYTACCSAARRRHQQQRHSQRSRPLSRSSSYAARSQN